MFVNSLKKCLWNLLIGNERATLMYAIVDICTQLLFTNVNFQSMYNQNRSSTHGYFLAGKTMLWLPVYSHLLYIFVFIETTFMLTSYSYIHVFNGSQYVYRQYKLHAFLTWSFWYWCVTLTGYHIYAILYFVHSVYSLLVQLLLEFLSTFW